MTSLAMPDAFDTWKTLDGAARTQDGGRYRLATLQVEAGDFADPFELAPETRV